MEAEHTRHIDWRKAVVAGLIATVVMTITMALFGTNIMKMLGGMVLGAGAGTAAQYAVGALMHLMIGVVYGVAYAALIGPVRQMSTPAKGAVYGLALTGIALALMPAMAAMMGGGGAAGNPCSPQAVQTTAAGNPCGDGAAAQAVNPCNPCGDQAATRSANPCNPCAVGASNPCGGSASSPYSGLISLLNHLVYGVVLAYAYGRGTA